MSESNSSTALPHFDAAITSGLKGIRSTAPYVPPKGRRHVQVQGVEVKEADFKFKVNGADAAIKGFRIYLTFREIEPSDGDTTGTLGTWAGERSFWPSNVAELDRVPVEERWKGGGLPGAVDKEGKVRDSIAPNRLIGNLAALTGLDDDAVKNDLGTAIQIVRERAQAGLIAEVKINHYTPKNGGETQVTEYVEGLVTSA